MRILNLPDGAQEGGGAAMQVSDEDVQAIRAFLIETAYEVRGVN